MLANTEKPPVIGLEIVGVFCVTGGVGCPKTEDRPKTGVVTEEAGDIFTDVSKADTLTGVVVVVVSVDLKNGELLSGAPKTLSESEKVDCLRFANAPPTEGGLYAVDSPKGDGDGLRSSGDKEVIPTAVGDLDESGEDTGDGAETPG